MAATIWLHEHGHRRPTFPCPRCGREAPILGPHQEHLRHQGWWLYSIATIVSWCGHAHESVLLPDADGW